MDKAIEVTEGPSGQDPVVNNTNVALREDTVVRVVTPEPEYDLVTGET